MANYLKSNLRKGRTNRPVPASRGLGSLLNGLDTKGSLRLVRLWRAWGQLMGEMSHIARPLGHRGTRLILAAEDPMLMQEAQFIAPMILEKINNFFGEEVFDKVVFELLNGRVPLDGQVEQAPPPPPTRPQKPRFLGTLNDKLDPESPVGRCYRAYQRIFEE